jgi:hypothetical protein
VIQWVLIVIAWALALPLFCLRSVLVLIKRRRFWSIAYRASIPCPTCDATISLVGIWQCRCGYTYRGHLLRECPVCHSLPRMVRCFSCGTTKLLPEP